MAGAGERPPVRHPHPQRRGTHPERRLSDAWRRLMAKRELSTRSERAAVAAVLGWPEVLPSPAAIFDSAPFRIIRAGGRRQSTYDWSDPVDGREYWIATDGNDSTGLGTRAAPWNTIGR